MTDASNPFGITREDVLNLAAQKIADAEIDRDFIYEKTKKIIDDRVNAAIGDNVGKGLIAKIDALLNAEMEKILREEIVPVNMWGEREGQPTTIRNQIADLARKFWDQKVDKEGKLSTYGGSPRHEHLFRSVLNDEFNAAVKQNVTNIIGAFKDAIKADAARITDEHIDKLIAVKTTR